MSGSEWDTAYLHRLVDGLREGDRESADRLIRAAQARMETLARARLRECPTVRRWVEPEDVLNGALFRLQRALLEVRPESTRSFCNFAAEMIRRELVDLARQLRGPQFGPAANLESNRGRVDSAGQIAADLEPVAPQETPDELAQWTAFHEAVQRLPDELGETFRLRLYGGMAVREIAALMETNERRVRRNLRRAQVALAPYLEDRPG
jgi:RNA polymerase sigma-70 factor (ECF subfamily)